MTFEQHILPLAPALKGAAMRLTRNPAEAEDLVQDSMVRAFRFWDTFEPETNVKAWMFTILRNTFINGYHRNGRRAVTGHAVREHADALGDGATILAFSRVPGADEAIDIHETVARVRAAIDALPDKYRIAVTLCDLDGLSYSEIAEIMGCPIGTVMSRIYRGRRLLQVLLSDHAAALGIVGTGT